MPIVSCGCDRENGNFEEGVLLKAFSWRQPRFFPPTLLKRLSNVVTITLIPTSKLPLRHSSMFPRYFPSVHHAGFGAPWSNFSFGLPSLQHSSLAVLSIEQVDHQLIGGHHNVDGSPPGSAIPGILQARTLEWVAISFSNAWTWKVKVKSLSPQ